MTSSKRIVASLILLASGAVFGRAQTAAVSSPVDQVAASRWFIRPSVVYGIFNGGDFKDTAGGALAVGASVNRFSDVELEAIFLPSEVKEFTSLKQKFTPILASYRVNLPIGPTISAHVGASIGDTYERASLSGYGWYGTSMTANAFTFGATGDLEFKVCPYGSVVTGLKVLRVNNSKLTSSGGMEVVELGFAARF